LNITTTDTDKRGAQPKYI